mgnify:CR=1 FL=1
MRTFFVNALAILERHPWLKSPDVDLLIRLILLILSKRLSKVAGHRQNAPGRGTSLRRTTAGQTTSRIGSFPRYGVTVARTGSQNAPASSRLSRYWAR